MLKNQNIICISSIDWDFIWQGHQEIMSSFANNGNRVLFVENTGVRTPGFKDLSRIRKRIKNWFKGVKGIRQEADNLYIYSPLVLPFPYSKIARWINRRIILGVLDRWMSVMDFNNPVLWTFLPTPLCLDIAGRIVKKLFIYYCIDNFSVSSSEAKKITASERNVLKSADLVFVTSNELETMSLKYNKKVFSFPFAVNYPYFEKIRQGKCAIPDQLSGIKPPIVGYVGGIHKWVDFKLIKETAEENPDCSFVFIGPEQVDISGLRSISNIHFLGKKGHDELPFYINYFDACIIPYLITDYTKNVYPTKLNEYFAFGKPVISTSLQEIERFEKKYQGTVYIAKDKKEFSDFVRKAVFEKDSQLSSKRMEIAEENSWEKRIEKMSELIENELIEKKKNKQARWKENMAGFYRSAKRKALITAAVLVFVYLLFFKTAFLWFLASPLEISEPLRKADCILVFGGGVGETGSPGKSTIERARYAAQLYKQGYANKIIFSSGYDYTYNDAANMKLFAISMGVPDSDIVLEQAAGNTYENVIFSKRILNEQKWHSVLLISSSYNIRRAALVFNKQAKGIDISFAPVPKSQFYDRSAGVRFEQIMAIVHEYMGIVYYLFKRYI